MVVPLVWALVLPPVLALGKGFEGPSAALALFGPAVIYVFSDPFVPPKKLIWAFVAMALLFEGGALAGMISNFEAVVDRAPWLLISQVSATIALIFVGLRFKLALYLFLVVRAAQVIVFIRVLPNLRIGGRREDMEVVICMTLLYVFLLFVAKRSWSHFR